MSHRIAAAFIAFALLFAACGGESATREIASLGTTDEAATETTAVAGDVSMEDGLIAFTECLREQGVDIADPTVGPDGMLQMAPIVVESGPIEGDGPPDQAAVDEMMRQMDAVFAECEPLLGEVAFTGGDLPGFDEFEDTLLEYAACMRDNGFDMPDPEFSEGGMIDLGMSDPNDPTFAAADEACRDIFGGFGGGVDIVGG